MFPCYVARQLDILRSARIPCRATTAERERMRAREEPRRASRGMNPFARTPPPPPLLTLVSPRETRRRETHVRTRREGAIRSRASRRAADEIRATLARVTRPSSLRSPSFVPFPRLERNSDTLARCTLMYVRTTMRSNALTRWYEDGRGNLNAFSNVRSLRKRDSEWRTYRYACDLSANRGLARSIDNRWLRIFGQSRYETRSECI